MRERNRILRSLSRLTLGLALAAALPAAAETRGLQARGAAGNLLLIEAADGHHVELPDGRRQPLPLSPAGRVNDFRALAAGGWLAAGVDRGAEGLALVLLRSGAARVEALPAPETSARLVREPLLLSDGRRLLGLLWLEGGTVRRLEVRSATWRDGRWLPAETLSPAGPGTQIALTAARLGDGSTLAAWAAFDGADDEILWSRKPRGGEWSPPRPAAADNPVPDITPHLLPTAGGALLAWSRYDGNDYRVQVARFAGGGFTEPVAVGAKGSTDPRFVDLGGPPLLSYLRAVPQAWEVLELAPDGRPLRRAEAPSESFERPLIERATEAGVELRWPGAEPRPVVVGWEDR